MDAEIRLEDVIELAKQAGVILREGFKRPHHVDSKGTNDDLVTEIDRKSEDFILSRLAVLAPGHTVVTEESDGRAGDGVHVWYIDPVDGTMNYAHHIPCFCVSIGYAEFGELMLGVVYDPMTDECFSAEKGKGAYLNGERIRCSNCADVRHALVATGFNQTPYCAGLDNFPAF